MIVRHIRRVIHTILLILAVGCGVAKPAATPMPLTDTPGPPVSTATHVPPTTMSTPVPSPTATSTPVPPTAVPPTATPIPVSPTASVIPTPTPTAEPSPTEPPELPLERVNFITEDDVDIAGTLFGEGEIAVMFLHQGRGNATQNSWRPFAQLVAENGFAAFTFDFRGRGRSGGSTNESYLIRDARAAVQFLRGRGFTRLICVGAGMWGGAPCTRLALEGEVDGLVVVSSPMTVGSSSGVTAQDLSQLTIPKLFVCGSKDSEGIPEAMSEVYRVSSEPKDLIVYDSSARGTNLFRSPYGDDLRQQLMVFLEGLR